MGVFLEANKLIFIALEEETEKAFCIVEERPFLQETINLVFSYWKMTSFVSYFFPNNLGL